MILLILTMMNFIESPIFIFSWNIIFILLIWFIRGEVMNFKHLFTGLFLWFVLVIGFCFFYYQGWMDFNLFKMIKLFFILLLFIMNGYFFSKSKYKKSFVPFLFPFLIMVFSIIIQLNHHTFRIQIFLYYLLIFSASFFGKLLRKRKKRN